jgi:hypothetical protein
LIAAGRAAVAEWLLTPVDHVLSLLPCRDPDALALCVAAPLMAGARVSFLSPVSVADVVMAVAQRGVSILAGRWQTASGIRVTAYSAAQGVQQLRDGHLIPDAR